MGASLHPKDGPDADVRIHVDATEVRVEIALNLLFVDGIVEVPRTDPSAIQLLEYEPTRSALCDYFAAHNHVKIDGVEVTAIAAGFEVPEPDLKLLPLFPVHGLRALQQVKMVFQYPQKAPPSQVALVWGAYPFEAGDAGKRVDVGAFLDAPGKTHIVHFTESEPEFTWHALPGAQLAALEVPGVALHSSPSVPWISAGIVVIALSLLVRERIARGTDGFLRALRWMAPAALVLALLTQGVARAPLPFTFGADPRLPTAGQALAIFTPLHANVYRAFDYDKESDVYDALARSVHGTLLDRIYDQVYRGLVLQDEGGAVCSVKKVEVKDAKVVSIGRWSADAQAPAFDVDARWRVTGTVYHWGHSHERTNEYRARYSVAAVADGWRIVQCLVEEQRRIDDAADGTSTPAESGASPTRPAEEPRR